MKPSLVLWDWNGTLLDDVALCVDALNRLLRIYHYPQQYSLAQYREIFGFPIEDYYIRAGFDFPKTPTKSLPMITCRITWPAPGPARWQKVLCPPFPFERCRGAAGHSFGFQLAGFGTAGHGARSAPLL